MWQYAKNKQQWSNVHNTIETSGTNTHPSIWKHTSINEGSNLSEKRKSIMLSGDPSEWQKNKKYTTVNECKYLTCNLQRKSVICAVCHESTHFECNQIFCIFHVSTLLFMFPISFYIFLLFFVILSFVAKLPDGQLCTAKMLQQKCTWQTVKRLNMILSMRVLQNSWASCRVLSFQCGWLLFKCVNCDGILLSLPKSQGQE